MPLNLDLIAAGGILTVHLLFILWVITGWLWTRRRPVARNLHIASVIYGIAIEVSNLPCPLTLAEDFFERRGGLVPLRGPFLLRLLEDVVYPDVPLSVLVACAVTICLAILAVHWLRWRRRADW